MRAGEPIKCTHKERYVGKKRFLNLSALNWFLSSVYFVCFCANSHFSLHCLQSLPACVWHFVIIIPSYQCLHVLIFILWQEEEPWSHSGSSVSSKHPHMTFPVHTAVCFKVLDTLDVFTFPAFLCVSECTIPSPQILFGGRVRSNPIFWCQELLFACGLPSNVKSRRFC